MSLNKLAEGLAKAAKEVHAFHITEEDIQAAMKHKPIPEHITVKSITGKLILSSPAAVKKKERPEHCPHYCEIKEIQRNGETIYSCDMCGEWKDDDNA